MPYESHLLIGLQWAHGMAVVSSVRRCRIPLSKVWDTGIYPSVYHNALNAWLAP